MIGGIAFDIEPLRGAALAALAALFFILTTVHGQAKPKYEIVNVGYYDTWLIDINSSGVAIGEYDNTYTGGPDFAFVRSPDGTITKFTPPGATDTHATGINDDGFVTGYFWDGTAGRAFLRSLDGSFTILDAPGAFKTWSVAINDSGQITGGYLDSGPIGHGFVRSPDGVFTSFDVPASYSTKPCCINASGMVTGAYEGPHGGSGGFARAPDGQITTFAPPGEKSIQVNGVNNAGVIVGTYSLDDVGKSEHGFVRSVDGKIATIDVPGAVLTEALGIDDNGDIVGDYAMHLSKKYDRLTPTQSFVRRADGAIETFRVHGLPRYATRATAINNADVIVGSQVDTKCCSEDYGAGYIRTP